MRGMMAAGKSYVKGLELGNVIVGSNVAEVVQSEYDGLSSGDLVLTMSGWRSHAVLDGKAV